MLHHVHVWRYIVKMSMVVYCLHVVQKVNIPEMYTGSCGITRVGDVPDEAPPVRVVQRDDHFVNVEKDDVLVAVHVSVQTVVVGNHLVISLVPQFPLKVKVLKAGEVRQITRKCKCFCIDKARLCVVL